jgi:hypothetical protein
MNVWISKTAEDLVYLILWLHLFFPKNIHAAQFEFTHDLGLDIPCSGHQGLGLMYVFNSSNLFGNIRHSQLGVNSKAFEI